MENKKSEIQKNTPIFQIHQKTDNRDKEPCDDLAKQPVKEADSGNLLAGRRWLRTVTYIITSKVVSVKEQKK